MKKFLVGIVTLVAAVMLTSPAFGAYENPVDLWTHFGVNGIFGFENPAEKIFKIDGDPGDPNVVSQINDQFGLSMDQAHYAKIESPVNILSDGKYSGYEEFDPSSNIVVVKWGGNQGDNLFAFYIPDMTYFVSWENLDNAMSHVGYNAVPVPAAVWLLGSGVLGLVAVRRRRS